MHSPSLLGDGVGDFHGLVRRFNDRLGKVIDGSQVWGVQIEFLIHGIVTVALHPLPNSILYNQLLMSEKLYPHLLEIDRTAQERMDTMLPHMMETAGVTEELKACDPMRWVGLMNTLTAQIEEILIRELICS